MEGVAAPRNSQESPKARVPAHVVSNRTAEQPLGAGPGPPGERKRESRLAEGPWVSLLSSWCESGPQGAGQNEKGVGHHLTVAVVKRQGCFLNVLEPGIMALDLGFRAHVWMVLDVGICASSIGDSGRDVVQKHSCPAPLGRSHCVARSPRVGGWCAAGDHEISVMPQRRSLLSFCSYRDVFAFPIMLVASHTGFAFVVVIGNFF